MKKIFLLFVTLLPCLLNAQSKESIYINTTSKDDYILFDGKDTIHCYVTDIECKIHDLKNLIYKDKSGAISQVSKEEIETIKAFRVGSFEFERTPASIKPQDVANYKILHFTSNFVNILGPPVEGKIKLLSPGHTIFIKHDNKTERKVILAQKNTAGGTYVIKFDEGDYLAVTKKNYNEIILPRFNQCEAFKKAYQEKVNSGDIFFKKGTFKDISRHLALYNSVCK